MTKSKNFKTFPSPSHWPAFINYHTGVKSNLKYRFPQNQQILGCKSILEVLFETSYGFQIDVFIKSTR